MPTEKTAYLKFHDNTLTVHLKFHDVNLVSFFSYICLDILILPAICNICMISQNIFREIDKRRSFFKKSITKSGFLINFRSHTLMYRENLERSVNFWEKNSAPLIILKMKLEEVWRFFHYKVLVLKEELSAKFYKWSFIAWLKRFSVFQYLSVIRKIYCFEFSFKVCQNIIKNLKYSNFL